MTAVRVMRLVCDCKAGCGCTRYRSNEFADNARDANQVRVLAARRGWTTSRVAGPRGGLWTRDYCRPCSQLCSIPPSVPVP